MSCWPVSVAKYAEHFKEFSGWLRSANCAKLISRKCFTIDSIACHN